ncbi:MAG: Lrp/AsnC family transcriptional regulator [Flavobacteriales bacterium Tduv]
MTSKYYLDEIDKKILTSLTENTRTPFTEIAKFIQCSTGTIHVRDKKLEEAGIIIGSTLKVNYEVLGYNLIAFVGILSNSNETKAAKEELKKIPNIVQLYVTSGRYNLFCRIITKDPTDARNVISKIGDIKGVLRTESTICLEEIVNDENRLLRYILK